MLRKLRIAVRGMLVAVPLVAMLGMGQAFLSGGRGADTEFKAGAQLTLTFTNDTGLIMEGMQIEFRAEPSTVLQNIISIQPFKSATPVLRSNVIHFSNGRVEPNQKVQIVLRGEALGLSVKDFQWVRQGTLIAGKSRQVEVRVQTVSDHTVSVDQADQSEEALALVRFTIDARLGRVYVTQGANITEGALLAVRDQSRYEQLLNEIAQVRPAQRKRLEAGLAQLEIRSPTAGLVRELAYEISNELVKVELKLLPIQTTQPTVVR